jgi:hypothetical protein
MMLHLEMAIQMEDLLVQLGGMWWAALFGEPLVGCGMYERTFHLAIHELWSLHFIFSSQVFIDVSSSNDQ